MRAVAAAIVVILLGACGGGEGKAAASPEATVALASADVPGDLDRCGYSDGIDRYVANIRPISEERSESIAGTWGTIRAKGGVDGHITVYAESDVICGYWIAGAPPGEDHDPMRLISTIVIRFADQAAAEEGYRADLFGQSRVNETNGAEFRRGDSTGLGPNSVVWFETDDDTSAAQAVWQAGPFNVFTATRHLTKAELGLALANVNRRARAAP